MIGKKGQVTIFVIIGIVVVAAVVLFLLFKGSGSEIQNVPGDLKPPYEEFLRCVESKTLVGVSILESLGGYIDLPTFEPGSSYMPFSSQLDFLGNDIPYWYYVSGNNVQKEQVPTRDSMQSQLDTFLEEEIGNCNYDFYYEQGFEVDQGPPKVSTVIYDDSIDVFVDMDFSVTKNEESALVQEHRLSVPTKLGKLYSSALKVYDFEQSELFLEDYGIDVMNLYAPVTGVELACGPINWDAEEVFDNLSSAIEANTQALRNTGDSDNYFYVDLDVDSNVRFLNSHNWTHSYEVNPTEGRFMMAMPIGNQPGLGAMGFCYVPYHFVYNIRYPVLIQVYQDSEIFQFPMAVVILGNKAREPISSDISVQPPEITDFCDYKNTPVEVEVFDSFGDGVEADISYECSGTTCYIGKAEEGSLLAAFPQCVGGKIVARAEGYKETSQQFSTVNGGTAPILMDKFYSLDVGVGVEGKAYSGEAVVSFSSEDYSTTIMYPEQKTIELLPGEYNVTVYIYSNASIKLDSSVSEQCVQVPKGGVGGLVGLTEKRCFEIEVPEQVVSRALSAGGHSSVFLLDSRLSESSEVYLNAEGLPVPTSIEKLQDNYALFEDNFVEVDFR